MKKLLSYEEVLNDLNKNHNNSWYQELYNVNKNNLESIALVYRGNKITYRRMFDEMKKYAKALKSYGIKLGDEIPMCIPNTPEFIYLTGAASISGVKINPFGSEFDKNYIIDIINDCESNVIFVSNMYFNELKPVLKQCRKKIILIDYNHSNPNKNYCEITESFYKPDEIDLNDIDCLDIDEFLENSKIINDIEINNGKLEDIFTITYSSGSTNSLKPKAIMHTNKTYIAMGRYHDPKVSGIPQMKNATTLSLIPTHSNTNLVSSISDPLMQGGTVALEPIYDKDFYIFSLLINKPTLAIATRSFWIHIMKKYYNEPELKNIKLPFMMVPTSVGEPLSANEEKSLNKWLKDVRAGIDIIPSPRSFITMSVAGGDCEHSGIFLILFRALQGKNPKYLKTEKPIGMGIYSMVDIAVLDKEGNILPNGKLGRIVANSLCNMVGYKNNEEESKKFFIKDANGKEWGDCNVYGYIDDFKNVYVKGRIPDEEKGIPTFLIADEILKDTKKIMSCEVVTIEENNQIYYIAHIEPQINTSINIEKILKGAANRCLIKFGNEICSKLYFRMRSNFESFPLTGCGKRSIPMLTEEGLTEKCLKATQYCSINAASSKKLTKK